MKFEIGDLVEIANAEGPKFMCDSGDEDLDQWAVDTNFENWEWAVYNNLSGYGIVVEETEEKYAVMHPEAGKRPINFWKHKYDEDDERAPNSYACWMSAEQRLKKIA